MFFNTKNLPSRKYEHLENRISNAINNSGQFQTYLLPRVYYSLDATPPQIEVEHVQHQELLLNAATYFKLAEGIRTVVHTLPGDLVLDLTSEPIFDYSHYNARYVFPLQHRDERIVYHGNQHTNN